MLPAVTLGIPACKKHINVIVLSIIAIILICVGSGGGCAVLTSTVTGMMTRTSTIPATVGSDERPGLAAVGGGGGGIPCEGGRGVGGGGGPLTR